MIHQDKIFLFGYAEASIKRGDSFKISHPMGKRLTGLQKSTILGLETFSKNYPDNWQYFLKHHEIPVYYTSALGELNLLLSTAEDTLDYRFPISPKNFQNSVGNAAIAYAHIIFELHHEYIASSQGFCSFDKLLYLLYHLIASEQLPCALLVHGNGWDHEDDDILGKCEVLFLGKENINLTEPFGVLKSISIYGNDEVSTSNDIEPSVHIQELEVLNIPWLEMPNFSGGKRVVRDVFGETVESHWEVFHDFS